MSNINLETLTINNFNEICRTCSAKSDLKHLYENIETINKLETCTQMQFSKNDDLPNKICEKCILKLQDVFDFINTCKIVDEAFRKCLTDSLTNDVKEQEDFSNEVIEEKPQCSDHFQVDDDHECFVKDSENDSDVGSSDSNDKDATNEDDRNDDDNNKKVHTCHICNKILNDKKINSGAYKCKICNKSFTRFYSLIRHGIIHDGNRPYKCDICKKGFNSSSYLKNHKRIHSGDKPFKCDTCSKTFNGSNDLKKHKRTHTGVKPYKCDLCMKEFSQSSNLRKHKITHQK